MEPTLNPAAVRYCEFASKILSNFQNFLLELGSDGTVKYSLLLGPFSAHLRRYEVLQIFSQCLKYFRNLSQKSINMRFLSGLVFRSGLHEPNFHSLELLRNTLVLFSAAIRQF